MENRLAWIDIAKGVGILLVVIGHCIPDAASPSGISVPVYKIMHQIIYSFHMPLFFFLAGYLTYKETYDWRGIGTFIKKRFNRLLVPYFTVGIIYLPFKLVLSKFANTPYDMTNLWKIIIGINPDGELWFLYSLFFISIIAVVLRFKTNSVVLLIFALILSFSAWPIITDFLLFFWLGMFCKKKPNIFNQLFFNSNIVVLFLIWLVGYWGLYWESYRVFFILTAFSGIIMTYKLSKYIIQMGNELTCLLHYLGIISMDVYILSDIIKIPFRVLLWNKLHLYSLSFIVSVIASIVLSCLISKYIIHKSKLLKRYIIGVQ